MRIISAKSTGIVYAVALSMWLASCRDATPEICLDCGWDFGASGFNLSNVTIQNLGSGRPANIMLPADFASIRFEGWIGQDVPSLNLSISVDGRILGEFAIANTQAESNQNAFAFEISTSVAGILPEENESYTAKVVGRLSSENDVSEIEGQFEIWQIDFLKSYVKDLWGDPARISYDTQFSQIITGAAVAFFAPNTARTEIQELIGQPSCIWTVQSEFHDKCIVAASFTEVDTFPVSLAVYYEAVSFFSSTAVTVVAP